MKIIPVVNCPDCACVEKTIAIAQGFLRADDWMHIDVTDGVFSEHKTLDDSIMWNNMNTPFNFEVHLMVLHPEEHVMKWIAAGMKRIIIHFETITPETARNILAMCFKKGVEVMLASNPDTPIEMLKPYFDLFSKFLVLAVSPGPGGQVFNPRVIDKIKILKQEGAIIIEVDGGMNPETATLVKNAGADIIASGFYIFENNDPTKAYDELKNV